jgi:hypothetical protein|tara:strand:- start:47 stop:229 length:183 start_codon:yes stop_codon:yes gene_type:complete
MTLSSTQWMIDRIHCVTANMRSSTTPPLAPRFPDSNIFMIKIANLTNRGETLRHNKARLT